jgi:hypothetical protein
MSNIQTPQLVLPKDDIFDRGLFGRQAFTVGRTWPNETSIIFAGSSAEGFSAYARSVASPKKT